MKMKFFYVSFLLSILMGPCKAEMWDIVDLLDKLGLSDFNGLLESTGFMYKLGDDKAGPFTVYAPTNDAFNAIPDDVMKKLNNDDNHDLLIDLVSYHITFGNLSFKQWANEMRCPTALEGTDLRLNLYKNQSGEVSTMTASGSVLLKADQVATNGMVQVIDKVMYNYPTVSLPDYIQENVNLSNLAMVMQTSDLFTKLTVQNLTFFAPSNKAFENNTELVSELLSNHTLASEMFANHMVNGTFYTQGLKWFSGTTMKTIGGKYLNVLGGQPGVPITLNGISLERMDVSVFNGLIHVVDSLLFPITNDIHSR